MVPIEIDACGAAIYNQVLNSKIPSVLNARARQMAQACAASQFE